MQPPTPAGGPEPLLRLEGLTVRYGSVQAVDRLDLEVRSGELVALLGANGAGKSSILGAISRLVPLAAGEIRWRGGLINSLSTAKTVRLGLSHCPEGRRVLARQSVAENLALGAWLRRDRQAVSTDLQRCYERFPRLAERRDQLAGALSGGEQQMLAIARSLMARPTLLMLDEPSLGLAPKLVQEVMATLASLHADGLTILLVEQNAAAALEVADRAYVLESGRLTLEGPAHQLRHNRQLRQSYLGE